ncbi:MAG: RNA methyltransferase [Zavarzinella sp.]
MHQARHRWESGFFLAEGPRAVSWVVQHHPDKIDEILLSNEGNAPRWNHGNVRVISPKQLQEISTLVTPQEPIAVCRIPEGFLTNTLPPDVGQHILLLEHIQDPGNVGTLIRSAAAFGFSGIICSDQTADPFSPKVVHAVMGAVYGVWIRRTAEYLELVQQLQQTGYQLIATTLDGAGDLSLDRDQAVILAIGNEGNGLTAELTTLANQRVRLAFDSTQVESLNAAIAGSILMHHCYQARQQM